MLRLRRFRHDAAERDRSPLYKRLGWHGEGSTYDGHFRVHRQSWRGEIEQIGDEDFDVYIENPPASVLSGRFQRCFRLIGERSSSQKRTYKVHMSPKPNSVEGAIRGVEKAIASGE